DSLTVFIIFMRYLPRSMKAFFIIVMNMTFLDRTGILSGSEESYPLDPSGKAFRMTTKQGIS
ncbi:MAG: hypothetical protein ACOX8P_13540, partial [Tepidanaerobacteraceae bacterium]